LHFEEVEVVGVKGGEKKKVRRGKGRRRWKEMRKKKLRYRKESGAIEG
jgi:hypothetical protein